MLQEAINAVLNRADWEDTISISVALRRVREAAPHLVATDQEIRDAIVEVADALRLSIADNDT